MLHMVIQFQGLLRASLVVVLGWWLRGRGSSSRVWILLCRTLSFVLLSLWFSDRQSSLLPGLACLRGHLEDLKQVQSTVQTLGKFLIVQGTESFSSHSLEERTDSLLGTLWGLLRE